MGDDWLAELARKATEPEVGSVNRVIDGVGRGRQTRPAVPFRTWLVLPVATLAVAAAALAVVIVGRPAPNPAEPLEGSGTWSHAAVGVVAVFNGEGEVVRDDMQVRVGWSVGTLSLDVDPAVHPEVVVETPEGRVRVVGTAFDVRRDALGTRVDVARGQVSVTCRGGAEVILTAAQAHTCLPNTAAGLLGRARALSERGRSSHIAIEALDLALTLRPTAVERREIQALHVQLLVAEARLAEARALALEALEDSSSHRRSELVRISADLTAQLEGCDAARALLAEEGGADGDLPTACATGAIERGDP